MIIHTILNLTPTCFTYIVVFQVADNKVYEKSTIAYWASESEADSPWGSIHKTFMKAIFASGKRERVTVMRGFSNEMLGELLYWKRLKDFYDIMSAHFFIFFFF